MRVWQRIIGPDSLRQATSSPCMAKTHWRSGIESEDRTSRWDRRGHPNRANTEPVPERSDPGRPRARSTASSPRPLTCDGAVKEPLEWPVVDDVTATRLESLRRSYFSPMGGTGLAEEGSGLLVTLPTRETFQLSLQGNDWPAIEAKLSVSGKLYLYAGQYLAMAKDILSEGKDVAPLVDDFCGWLLSDETEPLRTTYDSWDHGTALRLDAFQILAGVDGTGLGSRGVALHRKDLLWASDPSHIRLNNHGLFLLRSLLFFRAHSASGTDLAEAAQQAISLRFSEILSFVYGDDAWCGENSPIYDRVWINLLRGVLRDFREELDDLRLGDRLEKLLVGADRSSRAQLLPTGHYVPRGDTPRQKTNLQPVRGTFFSKRVGVWVYHHEDLYLMVTGGHATITHKHVDETQLLLNYRGVDFFMDGGYHSYEYVDPRIPALKSPIGHSVLDLDGLGPLPPWQAYRGENPRVKGEMVHADELGVFVSKTVLGEHELSRQVSVDGKTIRVEDAWSLAEEFTVVSRFLLSEDCDIAVDGCCVHLERLGQSLTLEFDREIRVTVTSGEKDEPYRGWYSVGASLLKEGKCMEVRPVDPGLRGTLSYAILLQEDPHAKDSLTETKTHAQSNDVHPAPTQRVLTKGQVDYYLSRQGDPMVGHQRGKWRIEHAGNTWVLSSPVSMRFRIGDEVDWDHVGDEEPQTEALWKFSAGYLASLLIVSNEESLVTELLDSLARYTHSRAWEEREAWMTSADHAYSARIRTICTLALLYQQRGSALPDSALQIIGHDIRRLTDPTAQHIRPNNHGAMASIALIHASRMFHGFPSAASAGWEHLRNILDAIFDEHGLAGENSPEYQQFWIELLAPLEELVEAWPAEEDEAHMLAVTIQGARRALAHFTDHRGRLLPIGDSHTGTSIVDPARDECMTYEHHGFGTYSFEETVLTLNCGHQHYSHKHCDDTSITLAFKGVPLVQDSGFYGHDWNDVRTTYSKSQSAHSGLFLEEFDDLHPGKLYFPGKEVLTGSIKPVHGGMGWEGIVLVQDGRSLTRRVQCISPREFHLVDHVVSEGKASPAVRRFMLPYGSLLSVGVDSIRVDHGSVRLDILFDERSLSGPVRVHSGVEEPLLRGWTSSKLLELERGLCVEIPIVSDRDCRTILMLSDVR